jgi:hypothetical protein
MGAAFDVQRWERRRVVDDDERNEQVWKERLELETKDAKEEGGKFVGRMQSTTDQTLAKRRVTSKCPRRHALVTRRITRAGRTPPEKIGSIDNLPSPPTASQQRHKQLIPRGDFYILASSKGLQDLSL